MPPSTRWPCSTESWASPSSGCAASMAAWSRARCSSFPPHAARGGALSSFWPRATAVLTGWAMDGPGAARRYGADVAFPVSDHADCASLVRYAKATGARDIITHHGFAEELAQVMRAEGLDARALGQPKQLALL